MNKSNRTPVAYFHVESGQGVDLGWVGYCDEINEAMLPALLHPGGEQGAEERSRTDPPKVISNYDGDTFVPFSWLESVLHSERDIHVIKAMQIAAVDGMRKFNSKTGKTGV